MAHSLLYAVLVPGPVVTDQKVCVPIPDDLEKESGCLNLDQEYLLQSSVST